MLSKFYTCWFGIWTDRSGVMASDIFHTCCNCILHLWRSGTRELDVINSRSHPTTCMRRRVDDMSSINDQKHLSSKRAFSPLRKL